MIFVFNSKKVRNIYWGIFFIMSALFFINYHIGAIHLICDIIGASTAEDDLVITAMILPILWLVFNPVVIWIIEKVVD